MDENNLIIRAKNEMGVYEILRSDVVNGDFPKTFVTQHSLWLDLGTNSIEFRPMDNLWKSNPQNWVIQSAKYDHVLASGQWRLIEMNSDTGIAVASILSPLESLENMHIMFNPQSEELKASLPRLKLDFFMTRGSRLLESKQFCGMVVDDEQSFGSLTGLANKLVLRGKHDSSRNVIIPHGDVSWSRKDNHVCVSIKACDSSTVPYYSYMIDPQLGRLVDNGSLRSKLFRCYLHAVTANALVDNLTRTTGTEEAIRILRAASTCSLMPLEAQDIDILTRIAQLTPRRQYYPRHLKVMQEVKWNNAISPLSQHNAFMTLAQSLVGLHESFSLFQDGGTPSSMANFFE